MKCYPPEMLMMRKVFKSSLRKILRFPGAAAKSRANRKLVTKA